ncbi:flagellar biosynthetic protein FliQ [Enhygromyxa salina]|uniref:Bacterial export protein, family 3 n=1 Tax=Enhygromyxa salina TaxID=215803 RepID=A0A2S9YPK1_9BACT|nr:flagellar biosynthetic protein FliQ [Enhygromyxa salina]PRQ07010.1 Bacterial export protein, family 3 [Enhygromyxa salina]
MIDALSLAIREGFALVLVGVLPLIGVAAVAAILVGLLCGSLGIRDAALGQIVRALAVVLALALVISSMAASTLEFASRCWAWPGDPTPGARPDDTMGTEP